MKKQAQTPVSSTTWPSSSQTHNDPKLPLEVIKFTLLYILLVLLFMPMLMSPNNMLRVIEVFEIEKLC